MHQLTTLDSWVSKSDIKTIRTSKSVKIFRGCERQGQEECVIKQTSGDWHLQR